MPSTRPLVALTVLGWLLPQAPAAHARVPALVDGRYGHQVKELDHRVTVRVYGLVAETTVTCSLRATSGADEEAILNVTTPPGSVVTSLEARLAGRWIKGALLSAAAVRKTVQDVRGLPNRADPVWLEMAGANRYRLRVYPVPSRGKIQVRYTYSHPVTLRWGNRVYVYPRRGTERTLAVSQISIVDHPPWEHGTRLYRLRVAAKSTLEKPLRDPAIPTSQPVRASWFVAPAPRAGDPGHALLLVQGNPNASRRRWGTDVVFLVDRSRSMWRQSHKTAGEIITQILALLGPRTRFGVVHFHHAAKALTHTLRRARKGTVRAMILQLARSPLKNGTRIVGGLRRAYKLFGQRPTARRRLLVILTDSLFPERDQSSDAWPTAPKGTEVLALTGRPFQGVSQQERRGPLSTLALRQGGAAFAFDPFAQEDGTPAGDAASHRAVGQLAATLARPGRLTNLSVQVGGAALQLPQRELALLGGFMRYHRFTGPAPKLASLRYGYWGSRRTLQVTGRVMPRQWAQRLSTLYDPNAKLGVSRKRSLIVVHPRDAFGQDRLRFARRWGDRFFRRMAPLGALDLAVGPFTADRGVAQVPTTASKFTPGRLTKDLIKRLLTTHYLKKATRCYQATGPQFKKGRAVLYMDLTRGEVADTWIAHSTMGDHALHKCLRQAALSLWVARSWGDETLYRVIYPMRFHPSQRAASEIKHWRAPRRRVPINPLRGLHED